MEASCSANAILTRLDRIDARLDKIDAHLDQLDARLTHVIDAKSQSLVDNGALFFIMDEGTPICCGFFVSPTIGITVNHVSRIRRKAG